MILIIVLIVLLVLTSGLLAWTWIYKVRHAAKIEAFDAVAPQSVVEELTYSLNAIGLSVRRLKHKAPNFDDEYILMEANLRRARNVLGCISQGEPAEDVETMTEEVEKLISGPRLVDKSFIEQATRCVEANLSDSDYDRDRFAADMGMSQSSLYKKLRSSTGMNVSEFIRGIRMKKACELIMTVEGIRISDVAYSVGYKDPKYFATTFKKAIGMQPSEYLEKCHREAASAGESS